MEPNSNISFSKEQFNYIFPFYLEISSNMKLTSLGKSVRKIIGENNLEVNFFDLFSVERPHLDDFSWDVLLTSSHELFIIRSKSNNVLFRGQFEYLSENNSLLFIGSPWFQNVDNLKENELLITDFAPHDSTFDLLHIIKNIEINSDEIKTLLSKLKEKSDQIKQSEANYKATLNLASEIIYRTNKDGNFIYVNSAAEKLTGYSSEEILNLNYLDLIRTDYISITTEHYLKQFKNKDESTYFEFPLITKNGEEKWIGQSVQLIKNQNEIEFIALAIDITKQKKHEFELIKSNQYLTFLNTLINNTTDAIQVAKENGQLVYINNEAAERIGVDPELASNYYVKDFEKIFTTEKEWYKHVVAVKKRGPLIIEGKNVNLKTQRTIPVEVTVRFLEINEVGYIIANSRDITERKRIEEIVKKETEKYQNIIANMNLGLLEVDNNERIQYANNSFELMSGYSKDELYDKIASELFSSEAHVDIIKDKIKQRMLGNSDMYEVPVKNKKGELRWWIISAAPNYDSSGKLIGSIGIHLDITEQKQLEFELELAKSKAEESSKAKEAFLANMSHEIRTPLNAIIGMIRELSKDNLSFKQSQYANNATIASQHLLSVLNNVLDISKIEAGELQLESHHFDISEVLSDVKSILQTKASEKGLYLKIAHSSCNTVFIGDSARFRQIFLNLIGNAIKFTQDGGVSIAYHTENLYQGFESLQVEITDTGIGMEESYLKDIFNKFSQEDASTSRKYGGSGLGMAITYELIQLMNGAVKVKSKKNEGTTIIMSFLLPVGDSKKIEDTKSLPEKNKLENIRVLLVEDNEFNRAVACNTLNYYNCYITEAHDGSQAIDILKSGNNYDVILMDLQMPIMDGFEATKIVREDLKINTPIIALTANAFKSELEQCIKIGMNDCVTKPFEEDQLLNAIAKWTNNENSFSKKTTLKLINQNEKLYDLEKLISISKDDKSYVQKMIQIFIDQSLLAITQIGDAYKVKDLDTVYKVSHRIKPSIDSMGITVLYDEIRNVEKVSKSGIDSPELEKSILFLFSVLHQVINQLKNE